MDLDIKNRSSISVLIYKFIDFGLMLIDCVYNKKKLINQIFRWHEIKMTKQYIVIKKTYKLSCNYHVSNKLNILVVTVRNLMKIC